MTGNRSVEAAVARLITDLSYDAIPPAALAGVRRLMQDQLALQVGCSTLPWCRTTSELTRRRHVPGRARITASGDRMSAGDAAFVNATYGHSFEYDDAHRSSSSHPGSTVVSAALAIGEELDATIGEVVTGLVAGYEVYTRIGKLAAPELLERGWHPHSLLANFGAAAVAAKMHHLDPERTLDALSIAMSHASGTTEYSSGGGSIKRLHAGIGTRNGIRSAEMAAAGITGPGSFLTGNKGFLRTHVGRGAPDTAAEAFGLDQPFEVEKVWIKPYCCCGINHAYIDGARSLGDRIGDVKRVRLGIQSGGDVVVGNQNESAWTPQRLDHLQYSLPFQFSLALLGYGNGFSTHHAYFEGRLDLGPDSDVAALARKVEIVVDPVLDTEYPGRWVADIAIEYADGTTRTAFVDNPSGTAENPVSQDELDAKFHDLTDGPLGAHRASMLLDAVQRLDPSTAATGFVDLLQTDPALATTEALP